MSKGNFPSGGQLYLRTFLEGHTSVDGLEQSGTAFQYLLFSQSARSGTYCQISWNAFYLTFWHLFTMGGNDDYCNCLLSLYSLKLLRCLFCVYVFNPWFDYFV